MKPRALRRGVVAGEISPPGSKSLTIRAMAAASLARGRSHIYGALRADDTLAMAGLLEAMGVGVDRSGDPWIVEGLGGSLRAPLKPVDVRLSGLTARVGIAMGSLVDGRITIDGQGRLRERPMYQLVEALVGQGVGVVSSDGHLPISITGVGGLWGGQIDIDSTVSTQFTTALMLVSPLNRNRTSIRVIGPSGGYMGLTADMMRRFGAAIDATVTGYEIGNAGYQVADLQIEPDVSAAAYPLVGAAITGGSIEIRGLRANNQQPDMALLTQLEAMGCLVDQGVTGIRLQGPEVLSAVEADMGDAPDGALALAVAALFASGPSRIAGLSTLRHKESDRVSAMTTGLEALGGQVVIHGDTMVVRPGKLSAAVIDPFGDHRVAMSLALAGLRVEGVEVADPTVVDKTWPSFWVDMESIVQ